MNAMVTMILSVVASIISGVAVFTVKRFFAERDVQEKDKQREHMLILRSMNAIGKLTLANCIALRDGKTNGEMAAALQEYNQVDNELYTYLLEVNAKAHL